MLADKAGPLEAEEHGARPGSKDGPSDGEDQPGPPGDPGDHGKGGERPDRGLGADKHASAPTGATLRWMVLSARHQFWREPSTFTSVGHFNIEPGDEKGATGEWVEARGIWRDREGG